jgi:hypothetical protein
MVTDLSTDQRKRLNDGADLVKVLNESRDRWRVRMAADRAACVTPGAARSGPVVGRIRRPAARSTT